MPPPIRPATGEVSLRPLIREDLPLVARWIAEPHVARWWRDSSDLADVKATYLPCLTGEDPTEVFAIEVDHRPVGLIQRYLEDDYPEWAGALAATGVPARAAAGIDYLIGDPTLVGRGIGAAAIREFTRLTFLRYPGAETVLAAPQQANTASWRALERAGFRRLWAGQLDSDDPSDAGPAYLYGRSRPAPGIPQ